MRTNGLTLHGKPRIEVNTGVDWHTLNRLDNPYAMSAEKSRLDKLEYRESIIIKNRRSTTATGASYDKT